MTDLDTPGARLRAARKAAGFTSAAKAAEAMGIQGSTYAGHENGQNAFDVEAARLYAKRFKVSPVELLFGNEFSVLKNGNSALVKTFDPDVPDGEHDDQMSFGTETGARGIPAGTIAQIDVSAGMGGGGVSIVSEGVPGKSGMTFAADSVADYWRVPERFLSTFGVKVGDVAILPSRGDSMYPTISDGDFVAADTRYRVPSPDGVYALMDEFGGVITKRLQVVSRPGDEDIMVDVISDNKSHATKTWPLSDLRIIGLVIFRIGRL